MNDLLKQCYAAIAPFIGPALSALGAALLAWLRLWLQQKLAAAAVAHAEAQGGTGEAKKNAAVAKLASANMLLRPRSSQVAAVVQSAHDRMKKAGTP